MPDASSQIWNLETGNWKLPPSPPRDLVVYVRSRRREEAEEGVPRCQMPVPSSGISKLGTGNFPRPRLVTSSSTFVADDVRRLRREFPGNWKLGTGNFPRPRLVTSSSTFVADDVRRLRREFPDARCQFPVLESGNWELETSPGPAS
jgi:hypothetical protein